MISRDNFWSTENKHIENALNFFYFKSLTSYEIVNGQRKESKQPKKNMNWTLSFMPLGFY